MWIDKSLYWATSLVVGIRAEGSAFVLLSSHLNLSSPAFLSGALVCPPLLSWNLDFVFRVLAGSLGRILSFGCTWPLCGSCLWCFLSVWLHVPCTGLAPWGLASCAVALVGSSPLVACVAGCPLLVSLCSLLGHCSIPGFRYFSWSVCLLFGFARFSRAGCVALFLFSQASFVSFSFIRIPWLCWAFGGVCWDVCLSPVAFLPCFACSSVARAWCFLVFWILVFKFLDFGRHLFPFSRAHGPSMSVVGAFLAALIPLGGCSALFLGCGCFGGFVFFQVLRVLFPSVAWCPLAACLPFPGLLCAFGDWRCLLP